MAYISEQRIKEEVLQFLRNSDIFSISQRGVTTTSNTASLSGATSHSISVDGVRNIRGITIGTTVLLYGRDYTLALGTSSTANALISFSSAHTGTLRYKFDYGSTDKIYPDFPRNDLTISSFPRIGFDVIDIPSEMGGFGNVNKSEVNITIVVYDDSEKDVVNYIDSLRQKFIDAQDDFYYLKVVKPKRQGPLLKSPNEKGKDKIMQKNIDIVSILNYEKN